MNDFPNFTRLAIQDLYKLKAQPQDQLLQRLHAKYNRKVDKRAFGVSLMHHVSNMNTNKHWADLGPKDKKMLEGGGIKEDDWNLLIQLLWEL